ncbi:glycosyltransferase involved in cell wall biosynthesis [Idiomarina fontislapidosi]|uniref:Uncharacterized protein n=1 Tax=Idiomarina fontislapidosi TaxID=263723 RepID=A0A432XQX9_9GAMM|nr:glycosyltransferase [Idiomarina fontislapidosi]PYE30733.1 glycosyltransferase involved in cell wall biosynthesis [Idiomarina fontislapidosi]RUO51100.1 hypothetical protein CWE25_11875 [Idiomarina fontislapidosi]
MKKQLLYFVDHSFPFSSDGYAVRTHAVAQGFVKNGYRVTVINRFGRVFSVPGIDANNVEPHYRIDGVNYLFFKSPSGKPPSAKYFSEWLEGATKLVKELISTYQPGQILVASNWENAWPVKLACEDLGKPYIYEVRGFWELSRATKEPKWIESEDFKYAKTREADVANSATRVLTLNKLMQRILVERGVSSEKVQLLPNSLSTLPAIPELGKERERLATEVKARYGVTQPFVLAYIGTFNHYEGLHLIIRALKELPEDVGLLLIGGSMARGHDEKDVSDPIREELMVEAKAQGVMNRVYFTGRILPHEVSVLYSAIDVVVNTRISTPVTDIVSALKPIETAAHAVPMVLSDIGANKDINDEFTYPNPLFKQGDSHDLACKVRDVLSQIPEHRRQAKANREFVKHYRLFPTLINMLF